MTHSIPLPTPGDEPIGEGLPSVGTGSPPQAPSEIRTLLKSLGLHPQKGFGQNFLVSEKIMNKIVEAGSLQPSDIVVEVGPGLGHLTHHLVPLAKRVIAVEIDRGFVRNLTAAFQGVDNLEVREADVLTLDPATIADGQPYKLIANLPYYITSAVLRHFLENSHRPTTVVVMLQKEVAQRIVAPKGDLNLLAVSVQIYGQPKLVAKVPAAAFYPRPNVESAVLKIETFPTPKIDVDPEKFFKVVAAGFSGARKQVHNAIAQRIWMPPGAASEILQSVGIDPMRRAHTLSIEEWNELTRAFIERGLV